MRQALIVFVVGAALLGGVFLAVRMRERPAPPPAAVKIEAPAPAARATPPPSVPPPAPEPSPRPLRPAAAPSPPAAAPEPAPAPRELALDLATLHIDADVAGAQVFVDRVYLGAAPVTAENVKPGPHQLNMSAKGYDGISNTIDVEPGSHDILIKFKEVRLDASIDVIHKHRLGSCRGRLIADARTLRYDTADKGDAFSAALLDVDGFEIDYLAKTLKVQIKKGKRYGFTDPEGNADRLFVFHRDVEKARERLEKGDPPAAP